MTLPSSGASSSLPRAVAPRAPAAAHGLLNTLSACRRLLLLSLRRQFFSRQTVVAVALTVLCCLIVLAWSLHREPTTRRFASNILMPIYVAFLLPIVSICYGASAIGGEREDRTLIFLLITSIPRPLIYLVKFLATQLLVIGGAASSLAILCWLAGAPGSDVWPIFLPAAMLGGAAYAALFLVVGSTFRHGTIISLAYWFFLEVLFGNMPGIIKRISIAFYVRCMVFESGAQYEIAPPGRFFREMFLPVSADSAQLVLGLAIAALGLLGLFIFSRREYRDLS